jgi:hypothetical protein
MTMDELYAALERQLTDDGAAWLAEARLKVSRDPAAIHVVSPQAGRRCGRGALSGLDGGWTVDDAVRTLLIAELPVEGAALTAAIEELYWEGDAAEKRGVLRALSVLDSVARFGDEFVPLVQDALRTNDNRLIAAGLGLYGARHLDAADYRHGVLKCVFAGIPLRDIPGLDRRADDELVRMMTEFAQERISAGRAVPDDVWHFVPAPEA